MLLVHIILHYFLSSVIKGHKNIAFIFARGESKGVVKKNIKNFHGKPLIAWTIEQAIKTNIFESIIVSTDSKEIADIAIKYGASTPFVRPKELASDTANEWFAWKHSVEMLDKDYKYNFVSLPCISPLRSEEDIINTIEFFKTNTFDLVFTVSKSDRSPYVNMVEFNNNREVLLSKEIDSNKVFRRQDSPEVFNIVPSVYVTSPEYILKTDSMWSGKLSGYEVPDTRAVDIDTNTDFKLAEMLFEGSIN